MGGGRRGPVLSPEVKLYRRRTKGQGREVNLLRLVWNRLLMTRVEKIGRTIYVLPNCVSRVETKQIKC